MKKRTFGLVSILVLSLTVSAAAQEEKVSEKSPGKSYTVNLSLYYPVSINQSEDDSVNINLGLLYSRYGDLRGIDLCAGVSAITHRMEGIQFCGLGAFAGDSGAGIQWAGLMSVAGDDFKGLQTAGLMNVIGERGSAFQLSGLMNVIGNEGKAFQSAGLLNVIGERGAGFQISGLLGVVGGDFSGGQISGLLGVVGDDGRGFQASGLLSVVGKKMKGVQMSGLMNVSGEEMSGLQIAPFNVASLNSGLQLGIVNIGERSNGVQLGLVNYTKRENKGLPIGPVNIASNGRIRGVVWGGNHVAASAGVKFTVGRIYSIVSLGGINIDDDIGESLTSGFYYGTVFPLRRLDIGLDFGFRFRDNKRLFKAVDDRPDQHMLETRLLLGIPLTKGITALIGGGAVFIADTEAFGKGKLSPLLAVGLELF